LNRTHNFVVLTADQVLHGGDMLPVVLADLGRPLKGRLSVVPLASIFLDESVKAGVGPPPVGIPSSATVSCTTFQVAMFL